MARRRVLVDLAPLRFNGQFRRLWSGYLLTMLGSQLTVVALPFQVFRLTHSSFDVGLIGLAQIIPVLVGSLLGGSIADAVDRRRLLLVMQVAMGACSLGLFVNALQGHPALWPLYVLGACSAGFSSIDSSTRSAVMIGLVERSQLAAANSLWQLLFQIGQVAGPAVAGLLLAQVGVAAAYGADALSYVVAIGAVLTLRPLPAVAGGARFGLRSIAGGVAFLRGRQALQGTFAIDLNAMILGMPRALFPALGLLRFHGGAETVGLLYAAPGVGALIGALLTGWVSSIHHQGRAVLVAVAVWGLSIAAFGIAPWLPLALALLALAGAADVVSAVFRGTILQTAAPEGLRGRLSSIHVAVVSGGPRLGDFESGGVAAAFGPEASIVSGGLGCVAGVALVGWLMPRFAHYEAPPEHE